MKLLRFLVKAKTALFRVFPLMRDTRVPWALKVSTAVVAVLILSPLDLFSDIPILGAMDDLTLTSLLCMAFVAIAERGTIKRVTATALARR